MRINNNKNDILNNSYMLDDWAKGIMGFTLFLLLKKIAKNYETSLKKAITFVKGIKTISEQTMRHSMASGGKN